MKSGYTEEYAGDARKRDASYHQGITWPWLLMLYYNALKYAKDITGKKEYEEKFETFIKKIYETYQKVIYQKPCINGISELNDSVFPNEAKGAINQAWSVSAIITILF